MIHKKTWKEFRDSGLAWWINTMLHMFGWAIVYDIADDGETVIEVYPARVRFRGFSTDIVTQGYQKVSKFMAENAAELYKESQE